MAANYLAGWALERLAPILVALADRPNPNPRTSFDILSEYHERTDVRGADPVTEAKTRRLVEGVWRGDGTIDVVGGAPADHLQGLIDKLDLK